MKKYVKYMGIPLVIAGSLLLIINYVAGLTAINALQFAALALILIGVAGYIADLKKSSEY